MTDPVSEPVVVLRTIPNVLTLESVESLLQLCNETAAELVRFQLHRKYKPREGCETVLLFNQNPCPEVFIVKVEMAADGYMMRVVCKRHELLRWLPGRIAFLRRNS